MLHGGRHIADIVYHYFIHTRNGLQSRQHFFDGRSHLLGRRAELSCDAVIKNRVFLILLCRIKHRMIIADNMLFHKI